MRKGLLICEEMRKYFPIYEDAVSHYMTLQLLHCEFPYIWGKLDFLFYQCIFLYSLKALTIGASFPCGSTCPCPANLNGYSKAYYGNWIQGLGNQVTGSWNTVVGRGNLVTGNWNQARDNGNLISGTKISVQGSGNNVTASSCTVKGNGNTVSGLNSIVSGNGNTVRRNYQSVNGNGLNIV